MFPGLILPSGGKLSYLGKPKPDKPAHPLYNRQNWGNTRDPELIGKIYEAFPEAGIGIACAGRRKSGRHWSATISRLTMGI